MPSQVNAAIGGLKFVTEDELKQLKGASAGEDDTNINQSDKPLSEVLRAAAERKEEEFQVGKIVISENTYESLLR